MKKRVKHILQVLTGDDLFIIGQCTTQVQRKFVQIGLLVGLVCILCLCSALIAFHGMFQSYVVAIPLALFFAATIANLYILLLYTLSRNSFEDRATTKAKKFSRILRLSFIGFIALLVSKPLESGLLRAELQPLIENLKREQLAEFQRLSREQADTRIEELLNLERLEEGSTLTVGRNYSIEIAAIEADWKARGQEMQSSIRLSPYFIQGLGVMTRELPGTWILTLICLCLFLGPAWIKNQVSEDPDFFDKKRRIEEQLVIEDYQIFRQRYAAMYRTQFGRDLKYPELYHDPPFNQHRKVPDLEYRTEKDLISELYDL